jgi:hypothetical protein
MSTLPWQANFAGLIGGIVIGIVLTFALVPFVNLTKYNRKSKVSVFCRGVWVDFFFDDDDVVFRKTFHLGNFLMQSFKLMQKF